MSVHEGPEPKVEFDPEELGEKVEELIKAVEDPSKTQEALGLLDFILAICDMTEGLLTDKQQVELLAACGKGMEVNSNKPEIVEKFKEAKARVNKLFNLGDF